MLPGAQKSIVVDQLRCLGDCQGELKQFKQVFDRFDDNNNGEALVLVGLEVLLCLVMCSFSLKVEVLELADMFRQTWWNGIGICMEWECEWQLKIPQVVPIVTRV